MLFSSLQFLFVFLPLVLLFYYCSPRIIRNQLLMLFSLVFYAWGGFSHLLVLLASVFVNYFIAKRICQTPGKERFWLRVGLIFNVSFLVFFKYLNFFIDNLNGTLTAISGTLPTISNASIVLPLGVSFFTFHQMSMLWDLYRREVKPSLKLSDTVLYIAFFPQLIAGPIVRYHDIIEQIRSRKETMLLFSSGVRRFVIGLFKKVAIANTCASLADEIMGKNLSDLSSSATWLGIVAYSLQIYFDFSGYSDMAIGLARMFGFRLLENFNFPYISLSIKEFWRRWHISLSSWFRDYVYIPLGGNRVSLRRTYINLLLVFFLTGFWHGASWSFIFWGLFHGSFLVIEKLGFENLLARIPKPLAWLYTMVIVVIGWVFFRIENFADAWQYSLRMFSFSPGKLNAFYFLDQEKIMVLLLAIICSSTLLLKIRNYFGQLSAATISRLFIPYKISEAVFISLMFFYCLLILNAGSYNPFIYFRF